MSREIKFRIWDNDKNEWLAESDGDALTYYGFHLIGEVLTVQSPRKWTVDGVVEQYTGLKDNNGKEIYEGDIVKSFGRFYEVAYNEHYAAYMFKNNHLEDELSRELFYSSASDYEVVSNIHENPELLEGANIVEDNNEQRN